MKTVQYEFKITILEDLPENLTSASIEEGLQKAKGKIQVGLQHSKADITYIGWLLIEDD